MQENLQQSELDQLNQTLQELSNKLKKQVSLKHNFALSIVRGLGLALGGTIILGIVITILARVLATISTVPVLETLINQQVIEQLQESSQ